MGRKRRKDRHLPERMYLRSGGYYFVEYGSNSWTNLGRDYVKAMAEYARIRDSNRPLSTMSDVIDRYVAEVAPLKAESTYKGNLIEAKYLRAAFGKMEPSRISGQNVYAYLDERAKTSKVRANREIALLSHMFKKAGRWGAVPTDFNPCRGVERFKEKARDRYVDDAEFFAFRKVAGDFLAAYMDVKVLTGLRQGDLLDLRLDQLKDDGIHVSMRKTGKRQIIQWSVELRAAIQQARRLRRRIGSLYLFSTRSGSPYSRDGFKSIWQRRMTSAVEKGVLATRFTEHDLRRKTGSDTTLEHARQLLGHADSGLTQRVYRVKPDTVKPLR